MSKKQEATTQAVKLDVRVYPLEEPKRNTLAYASVTINDMFAVNGIRVMDSEKGKFAAMPSAKDKNGEYRDICFPVTADLRKQLNTAVLEGYEEAVQEKASVRDQIKEGATTTKNTPSSEKTAKKTEPEL